METVQFSAPSEYVEMLTGIRKTPFAKTDDGYRFAMWVYELNNTEDDMERFRESTHGEEAVKLLEQAKAQLENIVITEDDYLGWTINKKDAGGVEQYHKVIHDLSIGLFMLNISLNMSQVRCDVHNTESSLYCSAKKNQNAEDKMILNKNNPFADVNIKSQQFFYKAGDGSTETLFFNTNNIVEKVDKNGKDMLTVRPSFSVSKEHGVVQKPIQKVIFANSITEPIVGDEDHIYIHID